jgi:hypothetical protein
MCPVSMACTVNGRLSPPFSYSASSALSSHRSNESHDENDRNGGGVKVLYSDSTYGVQPSIFTKKDTTSISSSERDNERIIYLGDKSLTPGPNNFHKVYGILIVLGSKPCCRMPTLIRWWRCCSVEGGDRQGLLLEESWEYTGRGSAWTVSSEMPIQGHDEANGDCRSRHPGRERYPAVDQCINPRMLLVTMRMVVTIGTVMFWSRFLLRGRTAPGNRIL